MTEQGQSGGRHTFLGLAAVILGGLLFAAGVMVGRQMGVGSDDSHKDHLDRIDRRDEGQAAADAGQLVFHKELSRPDKPAAKSPPPEPQKPKAAEAAPAKKPTPPPPPAKPAPAAADGAKKFSLQVASFKEADQAKELVSKLKAKGYGKARMVRGEVPGKGTYFRVRLGPFGDRSTAQKAQERLLAKDRLKALVVIEE